MFVNDSIFICSFPSCILAQVFIIIHKLPNLLHLKYNEHAIVTKGSFFQKKHSILKTQNHDLQILKNDPK